MARACWAPLALAAVLALAACDGVGADEPEPAADDGLKGVALDELLHKPDAQLVDHHGEPWDLRSETDGKLTFLFFGYASCPDICPVHMANLTAVFDRLPSTVTDRIAVVFVTTDPARDDPEHLREFMASFDDDFTGVTGDLDEIVALMDALDLPAPVHEEPDDDGFYEVGHPAQLLAFQPHDDRASHAYPWGMRQEDFLHDIPGFLDGEAS